ncbi:hypothetical protein IAU59_006029 [Kwoniella sp. CBS 9459]
MSSHASFSWEPSPTDSEKQLDFGYGSSHSDIETDRDTVDTAKVTLDLSNPSASRINSSQSDAAAPEADTRDSIVTTGASIVTKTAASAISSAMADPHSRTNRLTVEEITSARNSLTAATKATGRAMKALNRYKAATGSLGTKTNSRATNGSNDAVKAKEEFAGAFKEAEMTWRNMPTSDTAIISGWANGKIPVSDDDQDLRAQARSWTFGRLFTDQWEIQHGASEAGMHK